MLLDIIKPIFAYHNTVDPIQPESLSTLYVEIGQYHIAHFVLSSQGNILTNYSLFSTTDELNADSVVDFLQQSSLSQKQYDKQVIIHHSSEVVLMPQELHTQSSEKLILDTLHGNKTHYTIFRDQIDPLDMVNVFEVDTKIIEMSSNLFSSVNHTHINSIVMNRIDREHINTEQGLINIIFHPSTIHLSVVLAGELKIAQTFFYETKDDVSYNLLSVMENYQLNAEKVNIQVSGYIKEDSIYMHAINEHAFNTQFLLPSVNLNMLSDSKLPLHYFTPLFLSTQCV